MDASFRPAWESCSRNGDGRGAQTDHYAGPVIVRVFQNTPTAFVSRQRFTYLESVSLTQKIGEPSPLSSPHDSLPESPDPEPEPERFIRRKRGQTSQASGNDSRRLSIDTVSTENDRLSRLVPEPPHSKPLA